MNVRNTYLAFGAPDYTEAEIEAVARVMRSGWVGMGAETLYFEKELAEIRPEAGATRLIVTERGVFVDGEDDAG